MEEVKWMGLQMGMVSDCMCRDGSNEEQEVFRYEISKSWGCDKRQSSSWHLTCHDIWDV